MFVAFKPGARDRYYSVDFRIQRSFSNGFNFLVGYSYIREKTNMLTPSNAEGPVYFLNDLDNYNGTLHWLDSPNPHHRASIAGTYEFPFGKGRRFLRRLRALWMPRWEAGRRSAPGSSTRAPICNSRRAGRWRPDDLRPDARRWFDTSKFKVLPAYTLRTNPVSYPGIRVRSTGAQSALSKRFPIKVKGHTPS